MMLGTWLAVAYAVPRQVVPTVCAKTSWRPNPTMFDTIVITPMTTAAWPIPAPRAGGGQSRRVAPAPGSRRSGGGPGPGRCRRRGRRRRGRRRGLPRPSMSSQRSGGVRSITLVKLTTSLAAVSPAIPASTAIRAGRGRLAAAAVPSRAPSALAPASPSMARSARSSPSRPEGRAERDRGLLRRGGGEQRAGRGGHLDGPAGPQVEQVDQVGAARDEARVDQQQSAGPSPSSALTASPVAPMPPSLTAPVVTSPCASAPR